MNELLDDSLILFFKIFIADEASRINACLCTIMYYSYSK